VRSELCHVEERTLLLRMRLRRTGAKKQPKYRVVVADARAPRDGAFVDSIGFYDPLTEPATIHIDQDRAREWLGKGVQPSDTVQRLLRRAGIVEGPEPVYPERPKKAESAGATAPAAAPAAAAPVAATAEAEPAADTTAPASEGTVEADGSAAK
jgi:small subunit ribosomal protein S16